jgi:SAM-dependent methyltransferase
MDAAREVDEAAVRDRYGATFARDFESATSRQARRDVYGEEYPEDARPRSFITRSELRRMARELSVGPGQTFVDLGCGWGGPALWLARETGAGVVGIDLSGVGIARARESAEALGLVDHARFEVGDLTATGLPAGSFDGATSVDVLWSVPDKPAALHEIARILRPGARFVFTNWDWDLSPPGYPPPLDDHRPLLVKAGFEVEAYDVQADAECLRRAYWERMVAAEQDLLREIGEEQTRKAMAMGKATLGLLDGVDYLSHSRRIFVVARRRGLTRK